MGEVRIALVRGGTSRGVVLGLGDLAPPGPQRDQQALALIGTSPIDGLGGGTPVTNKVVLVAPSTHEGADIDYIVGNVAADGSTVDWSGTCGNMTSAVLPFAGSSGLVRREPGSGPFLLHNLATGGLVEVAVHAPTWPVDDRAISMTTAYLEPGGAVLGSTLPSGGPRGVVKVGTETFDFTLVDVTHPYLLLPFEQVVGDRDLQAPSTQSRIEHIRGCVCVAVGLCDSPEEAAVSSPAVPRVLLVHETSQHWSDVRITAISMGWPIESVPVTAALSVAAARGIAGTLVTDRAAGSGTVRAVVAGPAGSLTVESVVADGLVVRASVDRTARVLLRGCAWV